MTGVGGQCSQSVCFKSKLNVRREELGIAKARKLRFFVMLFFCCCFFVLGVPLKLKLMVVYNKFAVLVSLCVNQCL